MSHTEESSSLEPFEIENEKDVETRGLISSSKATSKADDEDEYEPETITRSRESSSTTSNKCLGITSTAFLVLLICSMMYFSIEPVHVTPSLRFPNALLARNGVYKSKDFRNEVKIIPPYWEEGAKNQNFRNKTGVIPHLGPCYLPSPSTTPLPNWKELMQQNKYIESEQSIVFRDESQRIHGGDLADDANLSGLCRPGFIVIGAGKCGTSSLYHYLVGHPRVLPAKNKQIHYFRYYTNYPMKWYLSNFPPAETFLSNGALMTGEASPGYLVSCIDSIHHLLLLLSVSNTRILYSNLYSHIQMLQSASQHGCTDLQAMEKGNQSVHPKSSPLYATHSNDHGVATNIIIRCH